MASTFLRACFEACINKGKLAKVHFQNITPSHTVLDVLFWVKNALHFIVANGSWGKRALTAIEYRIKLESDVAHRIFNLYLWRVEGRIGIAD